MEYRARFEDGTLRLLANNLPDLAQGELVTVIIERGRSLNSHRHQFAFVREAWQNLPEHLQSVPWAETPETMRKHALIATGFHQSYTLDCGANATAQRIKAQLVRAEARAEGYAIGQVRGPILTIWTPESQSMRSMGGKRFQESKTAILDWMAAQIGVTASALRGAA
ncbi:antitoxin family protein [Paracoccus sp. DMF]|uniref:antitoxin family protein n=1 Tax=Paracoccus sp. DMF TaxID=400837 RepID=UPI0021E36A4A|nr:antitoxin family protein [Paracoccus sp. DMF]MCV2449399.1 antitoxin family protein [Paracoccus sp. DMF]